MVGVGAGSISLVAGATIVNRWFETNRGTVMGILTASNATDQLIFLPVFGLLITRAGWRAEVLFIAAVCALLAPLALLVLREHPADMNLDHGIPEVQAAGLLAAMGLFDLIGTTASGWLSDRYSARWLLFWYYGLRGLSLMYLPSAFGIASIGLPVFAVFYGLDWIATGPPTLRLTSNRFGRLRAPMMFGWIFTGHQLGASLIAYVAGVSRQQAGDYRAPFVGTPAT